MSPDSHTWQEISSQPAVWQETLNDFCANQGTLKAFLNRIEFDRILVIGCGSTYYLAQAAAHTLAHRAGIPSGACPSSELWLSPGTIPLDRTLLVAVSRSGTTSETLFALQSFRRSGGGPTLTVTCYPESPLAHQADFALAAPAAQEQSVAQTRSFSSMLLLTQALAAVLAGNDAMLAHLAQLPACAADLVNRAGHLPQQLGEDQNIQSIYFLGAGPLYGIACEATLKTKEMSLSHAEAYHPLEFRHGPMSMVNEHTLVVGLLSDAGFAEETKVLADLRELGAQTVALVDAAANLTGRRPDHVVELGSGLDQWERQPLYLPVLQRLAFHRAVKKGLNPDCPTNLTAVVEL